MKIRCDNGLCDRLRMIFSYLQKSRQKNEELVVCWIPNKKCNGCFLDLFKPIPKVTFTTNPDNCDLHGWEPCPQFNPEKIFIYKELIPNKELEEKINTLQSELNNHYASIHVRRTDKVVYNGLQSLTSDLDFFKFIDNQTSKVFLATDNSNTQELYKKKYPKKIICSSEIKPSPDEFRETSLTIAAIDLFTCIKSKKFLGTNLSGFSKVIEQFHKEKKNIKLF